MLGTQIKRLHSGPLPDRFVLLYLTMFDDIHPRLWLFSDILLKVLRGLGGIKSG